MDNPRAGWGRGTPPVIGVGSHGGVLMPRSGIYPKFLLKKGVGGGTNLFPPVLFTGVNMANTTEPSWEHEPRDPGSWPYSNASRVYGKLKDSVEGLYKSNKALWDETGAHLNDAYANANDTVMEYKKDRPSQKFWDQMLTGTLESVLANSEPSKKALAHWAKHGIKP